MHCSIVSSVGTDGLMMLMSTQVLQHTRYMLSALVPTHRRHMERELGRVVVICVG